ncbi:MAG: hypothetical protein HY721_03480 [Planctomycetes bacterium]|nr:hypothetical protein [Planctomycetota bacterium]
MLRFHLPLALLTFLVLHPPISAHETALLRAPDGSDSPRGEARLGDGEIRVRGDRLPGDATFTIWIEGADGALAQAFSVKTESNGSFEVRQSADEAAFRGRRVEVRDAEGAIELEGSFPGEPAVSEVGAGTSSLTPPAGSLLPGASGRIKAKAEAGRHALEVKVRGLAPNVVYAVCVIDGTGAVEPIGKITTTGDGNGALEIDTHDGGALPFGASGIGELAGLALQVKAEDGTVLLEGRIPSLGQVEVEEDEAEVELDLERPEGGPDDDIEGDVRIETERGGDDKVRVRIKDADPLASYTATVHRPDLSVSPARETIAELTTDAEGEAEVERRGKAVLPLGAAALSELGGVVIEVLDSEGRLVLSGTIPQVGAPPPPPPPEVERLELEVALVRPDPAVLPDAHGKVELEEEGDEHEIEVEVQDLVPGQTFRVELRDPSGAAEVLAEGPAGAEGDLRKEIVLLGDEPLPFGVASFRAYDGFTIVVLDASGAVVLQGTVSIPGSGGGAALLVSFTMVGEYDAPFLRADSNRDRRVDIADPIHTLEVLFVGRPFPACGDPLDSNDDGDVDIADPIHTLLHLFSGGREPAFPGARIAGFDSTADALYCSDS